MGHGTAQSEAALPSHPCGDTGWCPWASLVCAGTRGSSAAVAACRNHAQYFNDASLGTAVYPGRREQTCQCTHAGGLLVLHTPPSGSVQPPQCVQRAPKGSSCPVLHIFGLAGLFSGRLSICQGKGLSRHDVKPTSFRSHSALGIITNPGEPYQENIFPAGG